jgi:hypothetical protein
VSFEIVLRPLEGASMVMTNEENLKRLLRRAICDLIEPVGISHISKDTQWRKEADAFLKECVPLVFGTNEAVFGLKRDSGNAEPNSGSYYVSDNRVREIISDWSIEREKRMLALHVINGRTANGLLESCCGEFEKEIVEMKKDLMAQADLDYADLEVACKNIGYDLSCGACAERFFTGGSWGAEHNATCATLVSLKSTARITITNVELLKADQ